MFYLTIQPLITDRWIHLHWLQLLYIYVQQYYCCIPLYVHSSALCICAYVCTLPALLLYHTIQPTLTILCTATLYYRTTLYVYPLYIHTLLYTVHCCLHTLVYSMTVYRIHTVQQCIYSSGCICSHIYIHAYIHT